MSRRMLIMLVATGAVFGLIFGFKAFGNRMMNKAFDNFPVQAATVTAAEARMEDWSEVLDAVGSFAAVQGTALSTESSGIVSLISFESGQMAKAGDQLLSLTAASDIAELKSLEAKAELAQQEFSRVQTLVKRGVMSELELDRRAGALNSARADVSAQRARIASKTLRAPFDGELGIRQVSLGAYVAPGDPIVTLQSLDPIFLNFALPAQHLNDVKNGLKLTAHVDAYPGDIFEGSITAVEPRVDASTRNFQIQATFPNPEHRLRPGMFSSVRIELPRDEQVIVIPRTAVNYNPYGNSVYVLAEPADDKNSPPAKDQQWVVKRRFVTVGGARGDLVAVVDGLKAGERVASSGLLKLQNDARVIIDNKIEPDAKLNPQPPES